SDLVQLAVNGFDVGLAGSFLGRSGCFAGRRTSITLASRACIVGVAFPHQAASQRPSSGGTSSPASSFSISLLARARLSARERTGLVLRFRVDIAMTPS